MSNIYEMFESSELETLTPAELAQLEKLDFPIKLVSPKDAKQMLCVSRQRIHQIIKAKTIPVYYICKDPYFMEKDILEYKANRKSGRPKKTQ